MSLFKTDISSGAELLLKEGAYILIDIEAKIFSLAFSDFPLGKKIEWLKDYIYTIHTLGTQPKLQFVSLTNFRKRLSKSLILEKDRQYKGTRVKPPVDVTPLYEAAIRFASEAGIPTCYYPGLEADDLIVNIARQNEGGIIFGRDKDLLVQRTAPLYHLKLDPSPSYYYKRIDPLFLGKTMYSGVGLPSDFSAAEALMYLYQMSVGDSADNIKGIKGFGHAGFTRMFNAHKGNLNAMAKEIEDRILIQHGRNEQEAALQIVHDANLLLIGRNIPTMFDATKLESPLSSYLGVNVGLADQVRGCYTPIGTVPPDALGELVNRSSPHLNEYSFGLLTPPLFADEGLKHIAEELEIDFAKEE